MKTSRHRNRFFLITCILMLFVVLNLVLYVSPASSEDRVVARVDGTDIRESQVREALERFVPEGGFHARFDRTEDSKYRNEAINRLVEHELLYREAVRRGVQVDDSVIDTVIETNIQNFKSREAFMEELQKQGLDLEGFRLRVKKVHAVRTVLTEIHRESRYTAKELRAYYEANRSMFRKPDSVYLYQIHIEVSPSSRTGEKNEKKKLAHELVQRLRRGERFYDIAYRYSDDRYRFKGGEMGFVHKGRLKAREMEKVAFSLNEGEISDVIETMYGFHIIKAGEKKKGRLLSFEEMKEKKEAELTRERFESRKEDLLERLRGTFSVEIIDVR